jgi:hypothetical protein
MGQRPESRVDSRLGAISQCQYRSGLRHRERQFSGHGDNQNSGWLGTLTISHNQLANVRDYQIEQSVSRPSCITVMTTASTSYTEEGLTIHWAPSF